MDASTPESTDPRPLSTRERATLDFLVSAALPPGSDAAATLEASRRRLDDLVVTGRWDCCPTVELAASGGEPRPLGDAVPLVEAGHATKPYALIPFVERDGTPRLLELVHDDPREPMLDEIPAPDAFAAPTVHAAVRPRHHRWAQRPGRSTR